MNIKFIIKDEITSLVQESRKELAIEQERLIKNWCYLLNVSTDSDEIKFIMIKNYNVDFETNEDFPRYELWMPKINRQSFSDFEVEDIGIESMMYSNISEEDLWDEIRKYVNYYNEEFISEYNKIYSKYNKILDIYNKINDKHIKIKNIIGA